MKTVLLCYLRHKESNYTLLLPIAFIAFCFFGWAQGSLYTGEQLVTIPISIEKKAEHRVPSKGGNFYKIYAKEYPASLIIRADYITRQESIETLLSIPAKDTLVIQVRQRDSVFLADYIEYVYAVGLKYNGLTLLDAQAVAEHDTNSIWLGVICSFAISLILKALLAYGRVKQ